MARFLTPQKRRRKFYSFLITSMAILLMMNGIFLVPHSHAQLFEPLVGPLFGPRPKKNIKRQFLQIVRKHMNDINDQPGLSQSYFNVGDPDRLIPVVDRWLRGVAVDPAYLRRVAKEPGTTPDGLTQDFRSAYFENLARIPSRTYLAHYDWWIILRYFPRQGVHETASGKKETHGLGPIISAFHEAIHAFHNGQFFNTEVDKDKYEGPHYITTRFPRGIIATLRNKLDRQILILEKKIAALEDYQAELKNFHTRIEIQKKQTSDWPKQVFIVLRHIGGKVDWNGYKKAYEDKFMEAMRRSRHKVNQLFRDAEAAMKDCQYGKVKTILQPVLRLPPEHLNYLGGGLKSKAERLVSKADRASVQLQEYKRAIEPVTQKGLASLGPPETAALETEERQKRLAQILKNTEKALQRGDRLPRLNQDVQRQCGAARDFHRKVDTIARSAQDTHQSASMDHKKAGDTRREACQMAQAAEQARDRSQLVGLGTRATSIAKAALANVRRAEGIARQAERHLDQLKKLKLPFQQLRSDLQALDRRLSAFSKNIQRAHDPKVRSEAQQLLRAADTRREKAQKAAQPVLNSRASLAASPFIDQCPRNADAVSLVKKVHEAAVDADSQVQQAQRAAEQAGQTFSKLDGNLQKLEMMSRRADELRKRLRTCSKRPQAFLGSDAVKRDARAAARLARDARNHWVAAQRCAKRARVAIQRLETGTIRVVSATYGGNCSNPRCTYLGRTESNRVRTGNATGHIAGVCNGKPSCTYRINYRQIGGDPCIGCVKDYRVAWRCGNTEQVHNKTVGGGRSDAGLGLTVHLSCQ